MVAEPSHQFRLYQSYHFADGTGLTAAYARATRRLLPTKPVIYGEPSKSPFTPY